jgi:Glycosyl transferase family 2
VSQMPGTALALASGAAPATLAESAPRPAVSVVVCAFTEDRWGDLSRALDSVRGQAEPPLEIILVVDHCPGLLLRAERELRGVTVMANRFTQGLSGGRNTGTARAAGDVVAFLDDDAVADPGWIARIADGYADTQVLGVGGLVRPVWDAERPAWFPPELDWVVGCSYRGMPVARGPVRNFIGANMSFRRTVLAEVGGFSTDLGRVGTVPLGCEETELCLRVSQRYPESVLLYEPAASVGHRVREQRATWDYLSSRCYAEGLSKARVASMAGAGRALSAERAYLASTVLRGVGRSLADAFRGRLAGLTAALILLAAVAWTGAGYLAGRLPALRGRAAGAADALSRRLAGLTPALILPSAVAWTRAGHPVRRLPARRGRAARAPAHGRAADAARRVAGHAATPWAGLAASLALWMSGLAATDPAGVASSGLGLVTALPVTFWAALGLLVASFSWALARTSGRWKLLGAHLLGLVAILHATPAIVYGTLRYSWSWKHVGVTDYIAHHGVNFGLGGLLGAYQGWPGFFSLNAFLSAAGGLSSPLGYAPWALVAADVLWLGPVILIARAFTSDQRLIWTAAWLFELGNWVGQDYFSPQAFSYFLYLTVIAVSLRWLWNPGRAGAGPGSRPQVPMAVRYALVACMLPLMLAIASSHQLTPFMLIAALGILAAFRQLRPAALPVVMAVATTAGWIAFGALPWLAANEFQIFAGLGVPWANTSAHLVGQGAVPFDQYLVNWGARLLSAGMGILAVIGFWRYRRRHGATDRRSWNRIALLAAAAFPAVAANSYGGEIIFRVYLFALPFLAVAAAAAFFPGPAALPRPAAAARRPSGRRPLGASLALLATSLVLAAGFTLGNYGKEAMNYFTPAEVAAAQWLYQTAPRGAQVVAANSNFPWAFVHYDWYTYTFLDTPPALGTAAQQAPVATMTDIMATHRPGPSYLILTKSQAAEISLTGQWPPGAFSRLSHALLASGQFRTVYHNSDVVILELAR